MSQNHAETTKRPRRAARHQRTRAAMLAAARALMAEGEPVAVAAAAARAGISRATAYRHFRDPETLVMEATLDVDVRPTAELLAGLTDPRDRVLAVQSYYLRLAREHEDRFRPYLARTLDLWVRDGPATVTRGARRLAAFREALAPAALPRATEDRAVHALSTVTGIEAHVALADVCRLDPEAADAAARDVAEAILDRFLPSP